MQDSATSEHSAEPAGSTKLTSYSRHVAGLVREGSVAKRVSQLQARISACPPSPSIQSNYIKSPARSVTETLSKYSTSGPLLSPASVPLPETPTRRNCVTGQSWQENSSGHCVITQNDETNILEDHLQNAQISGYITGSPVFKRTLNAPESTGEFVHQITPDKQPKSTNVSAQLNTRDSSMSYTVSPKPFVTPQSVKNQELSLDDLMHTPPLVPERLRLQSTRAHLSSSPDPIKRTMSSSSGSAYSKVLPFMSSPSVPSYIPKRRSRVFDNAKLPSPRRLKSMMLLDEEDEMGTETSSSFQSKPGLQSPNRQDSRSLHQRNINSKSDDSLQRNITVDITPIVSPASTNSQEDIVAGTTNVMETCPMEPSFVTADNSTTSSSNPHDIHNANYVPSVMPRRLDFRQAGRSRYTRSAQILSAQTHAKKDEYHEGPARPDAASMDLRNVVPYQISNSTHQSGSSGGSNEADGSNTSGNSSGHTSGSSGNSSGSWFVLQQRFYTPNNDKILEEDSQGDDKVSRPQLHHHGDAVISPLDGARSQRKIQDNSMSVHVLSDNGVTCDSTLGGKGIAGSVPMDPKL